MTVADRDDALHATRSTWLPVAVAAIRAVFGVLWAINAYLTWQPAFETHYVGYLQNAARGQPDWLQPWFTFWLDLVTPADDLFIWATRIIETLIAVGLLAGLARKWTYVLGTFFSLLIWSTAEGFGGPYATGASNLGPALVYVLVFLTLIILERLVGRSPYSVDYYLAERFPAWASVAEVAPDAMRRPAPPRIGWRQQGMAILGIVVALVFFFGTLESAFNVAAATPENAAAAVSPLQLAEGQVASARDATLPPLLGEGDEVSLTIVSDDRNVEIAPGVQYQAWPYGGTVPGPVIRVRQGQRVNFTYTNDGAMQHSFDFHAAEIAPNVAYRDINPGESIQFSFVAKKPGVFVYHCGTEPVLLHMANGMYGAIVVDPAEGMTPADVSYVLVQGEWYTRQVGENLMAGDLQKMLAATPDEIVFNGVAFQYRDHPLPARVGQRVRLYVVDAGPNLNSSFHVIGEVFDAVYPGGDPAQAITDVSTYTIAPGQGVIFDVVFDEPGEYPFVDHSMRAAFMGAVGVIQVME